MKNSVYILFLFLVSGSVLAQNLKVNCGNDTVFCASLYVDSTAHIGTKVSVLNGTGPYTYTWYNTGFKFGSKTYFASALLSDTSIANPKLIDHYFDSLTFYLKVEDAGKSIATDSIKIRNSKFMYLLGYLSYNLKAGDSVEISPTVSGGFAPYKYHWTPTEGLSDSTASNPWCKPLKSAEYSVKIQDAYGCESAYNTSAFITITQTGISSVTDGKIWARQEGTRIVFTNPKNVKVSLNLYSLSGKKVQVMETNNSYLDLVTLNLKDAVYVFELFLEGKKISGKYITIVN